MEEWGREEREMAREGKGKGEKEEGEGREKGKEGKGGGRERGRSTPLPEQKFWLRPWDFKSSKYL